jgi:serine/threonine protein kinase
MMDKGARDACPFCGWREGTPAASISELPPRTVINGAYMLGRVVGEGGFGITYIGWDLSNQRRVAVKEYFPRTAATRTAGSTMVTPLSAQSSEDFEYGLARFSEESRVLGLLQDHPCIVSVLDFQPANGTAYLVMEYLEGKTLAGYLRDRNGRIGCEAAFNVTMRILDGLREVHEHGLLHRDISTDNVFLTQTNVVKVLDFGAARFAMGERSQNLSIILKPGYAPPEQYLRRSRQGPQTDIYAAAATFYRAVTGQTPPDALERQSHDTLEPPSRLGIPIEPHVEKAILRAMSLEMRDRFKSAREFQEALQGASVTPGPNTDQRPKARRKSRPNVYLAYLAGSLVGVLFALPAVLYFSHLHGQAEAAAPQHANAGRAPSVPPPSPAASPPAATLQVNYGRFEAGIADGRLTADITFQIAPFEGRKGCAVLVLADRAGKYLVRPGGGTFELLKDFTTGGNSHVEVHFDGSSPLSTSQPKGDYSAQTILYANPCDVDDDPVISKSVLIPLRDVRQP